jgi:hypothetical protein
MADVLKDCMDIGVIYKSVRTTITGGFIVEFWNLDHLDDWLSTPLEKNQEIWEKIESVFARPNLNRSTPPHPMLIN